MASTLLKRNMRLFGLPYQFLDSVDPRIPTISNTVGRKFAENIILDAPVISIIPGKPKYLPAANDKRTTTQALLEAANESLEPLKEIIKSESNTKEIFKYYDFESSYSEYIKYVNILCRTCASFLELDPDKETIDGTPCQRYDYRNYRWDMDTGKSISSNVMNNVKSKSSIFANRILSSFQKTFNIKFFDTLTNTNKKSNEILYETTTDDDDSSIEDTLTTHKFVQFFVDTDVSANETMTNATSESKIKGMLDSGSDMLKELSFIANSGGLDSEALTEFTDSSIQALGDTIGGISDSSTITGALSRVFSLASNVAKGENVIMPDIYQSSSYDKSYSFTVHLKSPYGTKFGYFLDICVPLMHLICLGLPKQTTANTYGSPFLIKAYCEGIFTCNLGMVTSVAVSKGINSAYSVDGLPTEVDVQVTITDLYSDLSMSPQNAPLLFINNSSLVEYLATTCGLSLIAPNLDARLNMIVNSVKNAFFDIDDNIMSGINEAVDSFVLDFFGLTW